MGGGGGGGGGGVMDVEFGSGLRDMSKIKKTNKLITIDTTKYHNYNYRQLPHAREENKYRLTIYIYIARFFCSA